MTTVAKFTFTVFLQGWLCCAINRKKTISDNGREGKIVGLEHLIEEYPEILNLISGSNLHRQEKWHYNFSFRYISFFMLCLFFYMNNKNCNLTDSFLFLN